MNEDFNFNEKIKVKKLASELVADIFSKCYHPGNLTQRQKEARDHYEEFISTLDDDQKHDYIALDSIRNAVDSTDFDYNILFGMRIKSALDEIIKKPIETLNLYESRARSTRDIYKSIKQKREALSNE